MSRDGKFFEQNKQFFWLWRITYKSKTEESKAFGHLKSTQN